ncbi:MAG: hypothetical protein WDW36_007455 [Sanguina aurantia]
MQRLNHEALLQVRAAITNVQVKLTRLAVLLRELRPHLSNPASRRGSREGRGSKRTSCDRGLGSSATNSADHAQQQLQAVLLAVDALMVQVSQARLTLQGAPGDVTPGSCSSSMCSGLPDSPGLPDTTASLMTLLSAAESQLTAVSLTLQQPPANIPPSALVPVSTVLEQLSQSTPAAAHTHPTPGLPAAVTPGALSHAAPAAPNSAEPQLTAVARKLRALNSACKPRMGRRSPTVDDRTAESSAAPAAAAAPAPVESGAVLEPPPPTTANDQPPACSHPASPLQVAAGLLCSQPSLASPPLSFILDPSFSDSSPLLKSPATLLQPASPQQPPLALHPEHSTACGPCPVSSGDLVPDEGSSGQTSDVDAGALLMSQAAVAVKQQTADLLSGQVASLSIALLDATAALQGSLQENLWLRGALQASVQAASLIRPQSPTLDISRHNQHPAHHRYHEQPQQDHPHQDHPHQQQPQQPQQQGPLTHQRPQQQGQGQALLPPSRPCRAAEMCKTEAAPEQLLFDCADCISVHSPSDTSSPGAYQVRTALWVASSGHTQGPSSSRTSQPGSGEGAGSEEGDAASCHFCRSLLKGHTAEQLAVQLEEPQQRGSQQRGSESQQQQQQQQHARPGTAALGHAQDHSSPCASQPDGREGAFPLTASDEGDVASCHSPFTSRHGGQTDQQEQRPHQQQLATGEGVRSVGVGSATASEQGGLAVNCQSLEGMHIGRTAQQQQQQQQQEQEEERQQQQQQEQQEERQPCTQQDTPTDPERLHTADSVNDTQLVCLDPNDSGLLDLILPGTAHPAALAACTATECEPAVALHGEFVDLVGLLDSNWSSGVTHHPLLQGLYLQPRFVEGKKRKKESVLDLASRLGCMGGRMLGTGATALAKLTSKWW